MNAVFNVVYWLLQWVSGITGLSYEGVNVIVYYLVVPLVFFLLLDRILKKHIFVPCLIVAWCLLLWWVPNFDRFSEDAFERSVEFLEAFSAVGWNYTVASVLICVVAPGAVFIALLYYAFPKLFRKQTVPRETTGSKLAE